MKHLVLLSSFILLSFCSCNKKDDAPAPPITAENTFSCKIDGELFVPKKHGGFLNTGNGIKVNLLPNNTWKLNFGDGSYDLFIYLSNISNIGRVDIEESDGDLDFFEEDINLIELKNRNTDRVFYSLFNLNAINIRGITSRKNLILEFGEIKLLNSHNSSDTITISEGKLNLNIDTLNQ